MKNIILGLSPYNNIINFNDPHYENDNCIIMACRLFNHNYEMIIPPNTLHLKKIIFDNNFIL
jgi:hypothetical protein